VYARKASGTAAPLLAPVPSKTDPVTPGLQHKVETLTMEALATNGAPLRVKDRDKRPALLAARTPAPRDVGGAAHQDDAADELSRFRKSGRDRPR
jgi:hypothetical protein